MHLLLRALILLFSFPFTTSVTVGKSLVTRYEDVVEPTDMNDYSTTSGQNYLIEGTDSKPGCELGSPDCGPELLSGRVITDAANDRAYICNTNDHRQCEVCRGNPASCEDRIYVPLSDGFELCDQNWISCGKDSTGQYYNKGCLMDESSCVSNPSIEYHDYKRRYVSQSTGKEAVVPWP